MGMFDRVYVSCKCGERVEFQSKAGECSLRGYHIEADGSTDAPPEIIADILNDVEYCESCGERIEITNMKKCPCCKGSGYIPISEDRRAYIKIGEI